MNEEFRRFTLKSDKKKSAKITMPSKSDFARMEAHRKIERIEEEKRIREEYEL